MTRNEERKALRFEIDHLKFQMQAFRNIWVRDQETIARLGMENKSLREALDREKIKSRD